MTIGAGLAFAAAFFLLALSPGPGLVAILSRSLGGGLTSGAAVMLGLVVGDAIFLAIAIIGLSAVAAAMGPMFQIVKYAGAAYLIWLGISAIRAAGAAAEWTPQRVGSWWRDIALGLLVTLGNPKPILFYGALLPTFLDLTRVTPADFVALLTIVLVVSTVVYGAYMVLADRARQMFATTHAARRIEQATGAMLVGSGIAVAMR